MKTKITSIITLIKGIIMAMLGVVHIGAFFIIPNKIFTIPIPLDLYQEFAVWFNLSGFLFIFIGITDILASAGLRQNARWAIKMAVFSASSCIAFSFTGILVFKEGPPYLIFVISLLQIIPLIFFRNAKELETIKTT